MGLTGYPVPGKAKAKLLCDAFIDGAPRNAEGAVFYGVKAGNHEDWLRVLKSKETFYYIDNAYFDQTRGTRFRVTKNALQWTPRAEHSTCERFLKLGVAIQPWRHATDKGYILICPQSDDHMRYTVGWTGRNWLRETLARYDGDRVKVRAWSADKTTIMQTLSEDLRDARCLVTHTSAAAVMATLAGLPVVCDRQCAAFGMYGRDRLWWAGVLADNEFTIEEMKDGTAWRMLNK